MKKSFGIGVFFLFVVTLLFYRPFFTHNLLPIPSDILPGVYLPWLDIQYPNLPGGVPVKNALPSDIVSLTYPLRLLSVTLEKSHIWPLYNPQILSGSPLLANIQSAALYPLNIIFFLISDFSLAWSWQVILQLILAYLFTFAFLRSHHLSLFSSIFGAVAWSTCGFFTLWSQYNTVIHAILYLPLALLSLERLPHNYLWGIPLSLCVSFSFLAGNPPMTLILLFGLLLFTFINYQTAYAKYLRLIPFALLSFLIAAPLLLPSWQMSSQSIRNFDNIALLNGIKTAPLSKLVTLTTPDFYGNPSTLNQWEGSGLYDNLTLFQGCAVLLLVLFSIYTKPPASSYLLKKYSILLLLTSFILATDNPVSHAIGSLSFLGLNSMVLTRFMSLFNFSSAVLSALFIDTLLSKGLKKIKALPILILSFQVITPLLIVSLTYLIYRYLPLAQGDQIIEPYSRVLLLKNCLVAIRNSAIPLIASFMAIVALISAKFFPKLRYFSVSVLFLLMLFENYNFFRKYNSFAPSNYLYPSTPVTEYLQKNSFRFARETGEVIPSNTWMPYGLNSVSGYDTLHSLKYNQFINFLNGNQLSSVSNRYLEIERPASKLLNFLSVDHFIAIKRDKNYALSYTGSPRPEIMENRKLTPVLSFGRVEILKNPDALPQFYSVTKFYTADSLEETQSLLSKIDLSREVVIRENAPVVPLSPAKLSPPVFDGQAYSFSSESSGNSLLVTATSFDPSWQLFIDNRRSSLFQANHAFMAFFVPPGQHQIKLLYHPESFYLGLKLCFAGSIGIILIIVFKLIYFTLSRRRPSIRRLK